MASYWYRRSPAVPHRLVDRFRTSYWYPAVYSVLLMLVALFGAIRYLQRDWADKNQRARSLGHSSAGHTDLAAASAVEAHLPHSTAGHSYTVPSDVRLRFLASLAGNAPLSHLWLLQGQASGLDAAAMRFSSSVSRFCCSIRLPASEPSADSP